MLTAIQKEKFRSLCGEEHDGVSVSGKFSTSKPFNDLEWEYSPWCFSYKIQIDTGFLFCELSHRMTNNRPYGWDKDGNEIDQKIVEEVYPQELF